MKNLLSILLVIFSFPCHAQEKPQLFYFSVLMEKYDVITDLESIKRENQDNSGVSIYKTLKDHPYIKENYTYVPTQLISPESSAKIENVLHKKLRKTALDSTKNNIVILYFAGHGVQIKDENGDEEDQMDEALVLKNHPSLQGKPDAEHLWIDDDIKVTLDRIRKELGAKGKLILLVDACYSGTAFRTLEENVVPNQLSKEEQEKIEKCETVLRSFGSEESIHWKEQTMPTFTDKRPISETNETESSEMAPLLFISAARPFEEAKEYCPGKITRIDTINAEGKPVVEYYCEQGNTRPPLAHVFTSFLSEADEDKTFYDFMSYAQSKEAFAPNPNFHNHKIPFSGEGNSLLFQNKKANLEPYYSYEFDNQSQGCLQAGAVDGLQKGDIIHFYDDVSADASSKATAILDSVGYLNSWFTLSSNSQNIGKSMYARVQSKDQTVKCVVLGNYTATMKTKKKQRMKHLVDSVESILRAADQIQLVSTQEEADLTLFVHVIEGKSHFRLSFDDVETVGLQESLVAFLPISYDYIDCGRNLKLLGQSLPSDLFRWRRGMATKRALDAAIKDHIEPEPAFKVYAYQLPDNPSKEEMKEILAVKGKSDAKKIEGFTRLTGVNGSIDLSKLNENDRVVLYVEPIDDNLSLNVIVNYDNYLELIYPLIYLYGNEYEYTYNNFLFKDENKLRHQLNNGEWRLIAANTPKIYEKNKSIDYEEGDNYYIFSKEYLQNTYLFYSTDSNFSFFKHFEYLNQISPYIIYNQKCGEPRSQTDEPNKQECINKQPFQVQKLAVYEDE